MKVNVPSLADVGARFPQYAAIVQADGRPLYDLLTKPVNIVRLLLSAADGAAAVSGIAEIARDAASELSSGNRLVGALACCIAEANGFKKTGRKRSIPADGYSRGEVYEMIPAEAPEWLRTT